MLLFTSNDHPRVASGEITVSFRLWKYAHVKAGKTYPTTFGGRLQIDEVDVMPAAFVTLEDALLAGHASVAEVWAMAGSHTKTLVTADTLVYRVQFHYLSDSEVSGLPVSPADLATVLVRLKRIDALSHHGAWTDVTLRLIDEHPLLRAKDLMLLAGRKDLVSFKTDARKLKGLGLTISHEVGYELSDLGRQILHLLDGDSENDA